MKKVPNFNNHFRPGRRVNHLTGHVPGFRRGGMYQNGGNPIIEGMQQGYQQAMPMPMTMMQQGGQAQADPRMQKFMNEAMNMPIQDLVNMINSYQKRAEEDPANEQQYMQLVQMLSNVAQQRADEIEGMQQGQGMGDDMAMAQDGQMVGPQQQQQAPQGQGQGPDLNAIAAEAENMDPQQLAQTIMQLQQQAQQDPAVAQILEVLMAVAQQRPEVMQMLQQMMQGGGGQQMAQGPSPEEQMAAQQQQMIARMGGYRGGGHAMYAYGGRPMMPYGGNLYSIQKQELLDGMYYNQGGAIPHKHVTGPTTSPYRGGGRVRSQTVPMRYPGMAKNTRRRKKNGAPY
jgi:hypothetical protein